MDASTWSQLLTQRQSTVRIVLFFVTAALVCVGIALYIYFLGLRKRECDTMTATYGELNGRIQSIDPNMPQYQNALKDYYIKSAYNVCSGGGYRNDYVDTCVLRALLKQGVRGLDMELFSIDDMPVVATSTSDSYFVKETFNSIPFAEVLKVVVNSAFSSASAPNPRDPIFFHFRIKSTNNAMFKSLAKTLEDYNSFLLGKEYSYENGGKNLGDVPLKTLMGKIIIIVEKTNNAFMECPEFYEYVNMTSSSVFMRALHYYDIKYTPDMNELIEFNKQNMTIGMPDKGASPANPSSLVMREMGVQMLAMRYPYRDTYLEENEAFFEKEGCAFVLKPEALRFVPVQVELPAPQNPELSYATRTVKSDFYKFDV